MSRQALLFITVLLINLNLHASEFDQVGRFNLMLAMEVVVETELVITFLLERLRQRLKIIIMLV